MGAGVQQTHGCRPRSPSDRRSILPRTPRHRVEALRRTSTYLAVYKIWITQTATREVVARPFFGPTEAIGWKKVQTQLATGIANALSTQVEHLARQMVQSAVASFKPSARAADQAQLRREFVTAFERADLSRSSLLDLLRADSGSGVSGFVMSSGCTRMALHASSSHPGQKPPFSTEPRTRGNGCTMKIYVTTTAESHS